MPPAQPARRCDRCNAFLARDNTGSRCSRCRTTRDELVKPPVQPQEFWETARMREALQTWHMGHVFLAYRFHPWHPRPLSQELIGNWLGLTQVQVGRIEKGRAPDELSKLDRLGQDSRHSRRPAVVQTAQRHRHRLGLVRARGLGALADPTSPAIEAQLPELAGQGRTHLLPIDAQEVQPGGHGRPGSAELRNLDFLAADARVIPRLPEEVAVPEELLRRDAPDRPHIVAEYRQQLIVRTGPEPANRP